MPKSKEGIRAKVYGTAPETTLNIFEGYAETWKNLVNYLKEVSK